MVAIGIAAFLRVRQVHRRLHRRAQAAIDGVFDDADDLVGRVRLPGPGSSVDTCGADRRDAGRNRRANARLTTTTSGAPALSWAVKSRPPVSRSPIVANQPGATRFTHDICSRRDSGESARHDDPGVASGARDGRRERQGRARDARHAADGRLETREQREPRLAAGRIPLDVRRDEQDAVPVEPELPRSAARRTCA